MMFRSYAANTGKGSMSVFMDDYRSVTCFLWMKISLFCPFLSSLLVFVLLIESPGGFVRQPSGLADKDTHAFNDPFSQNSFFFFFKCTH